MDSSTKASILSNFLDLARRVEQLRTGNIVMCLHLDEVKLEFNFDFRAEQFVANKPKDLPRKTDGRAKKKRRKTPSDRRRNQERMRKFLEKKRNGQLSDGVDPVQEITPASPVGGNVPVIDIGDIPALVSDDEQLSYDDDASLSDHTEESLSFSQQIMMDMENSIPSYSPFSPSSPSPSFTSPPPPPPPIDSSHIEMRCRVSALHSRSGDCIIYHFAELKQYQALTNICETLKLPIDSDVNCFPKLTETEKYRVYYQLSAIMKINRATYDYLVQLQKTILKEIAEENSGKIQSVCGPNDAYTLTLEEMTINHFLTQNEACCDDHLLFKRNKNNTYISQTILTEKCSSCNLPIVTSLSECVSV